MGSCTGPQLRAVCYVRVPVRSCLQPCASDLGLAQRACTLGPSSSGEHPLPAGPPLAPNTPLNILSPNGSYVRTDNASSPATVGSGSGGTPPEQYLAFHPDSLSSSSPIQPYNTTVLQSVETGLWCRLAPLASNATQMGMVCDQATAATGTVLTYTGDGLSYNGIDLVASGPGQPLLLENTTRVPVAGPTADNLALVPAPVGERGSCQGRCSAVQCRTVQCRTV